MENITTQINSQRKPDAKREIESGSSACFVGNIFFKINIWPSYFDHSQTEPRPAKAKGVYPLQSFIQTTDDNIDGCRSAVGSIDHRIIRPQRFNSLKISPFSE